MVGLSHWLYIFRPTLAEKIEQAHALGVQAGRPPWIHSKAALIPGTPLGVCAGRPLKNDDFFWGVSQFRVRGRRKRTNNLPNEVKELGDAATVLFRVTLCSAGRWAFDAGGRDRLVLICKGLHANRCPYCARRATQDLLTALSIRASRLKRSCRAFVCRTCRVNRISGFGLGCGQYPKRSCLSEGLLNFAGPTRQLDLHSETQ